MNLTIVGLGVVGTSAGLAIKAATSQIPIMGHDPEASRAQRAKKLGAIDKSHWNLPAACEQADIILLDQPLGEMETTLRALSEGLKDGVLIVDTLPLKRPVMELAARILPPSVQFVGGHILSRAMPPDSPLGEMEPSAALLQGATFFLVAPQASSAGAVDKATNLATALGAYPHYIDADEHDGLMAATIQLPLLGAAALLDALSREAGWEERAGAVGGESAALASALLGAAPDLASLLLANRDNALHWLDIYAQRLALLRQSVAKKDQAELNKILDQATAAGLRCLSRPEGPPTEPETEPRYGSWRDMFLGQLGRRRPPTKQVPQNKDKGHTGTA